MTTAGTLLAMMPEARAMAAEGDTRLLNSLLEELGPDFEHRRSLSQFNSHATAQRFRAKMRRRFRRVPFRAYTNPVSTNLGFVYAPYVPLSINTIIAPAPPYAPLKHLRGVEGTQLIVDDPHAPGDIING